MVECSEDLNKVGIQESRVRRVVVQNRDKWKEWSRKFLNSVKYLQKKKNVYISRFNLIKNANNNKIIISYLCTYK